MTRTYTESLNISLDEMNPDSFDILPYEGTFSVVYNEDGASEDDERGYTFTVGTSQQEPIVVERNDENVTVGYITYDGETEVSFETIQAYLANNAHVTILRMEQTYNLALYGFAEDRSKVEVYSKADFAVLTKYITPEGTGEQVITFTNEELQAAGIYSFSPFSANGWVILSVVQTSYFYSAGRTYYMQTFSKGGLQTFYPSAEFSESGMSRLISTKVYVEDLTTRVGVKVVLMKS